MSMSKILLLTNEHKVNKYCRILLNIILLALSPILSTQYQFKLKHQEVMVLHEIYIR